jgi:hypothetical protein
MAGAGWGWGAAHYRWLVSAIWPTRARRPADDPLGGDRPSPIVGATQSREVGPIRRLIVTAAFTAVFLVVPATTHAHARGCHTRTCDRREGRHYAAHHLGPHYTVSSTAYCEGGITASGRQAFFGGVANNFLPLGTRIRLDRPVRGRRDFVVLDRIGSGSELDFFLGTGCDAYGRQVRGFRVLRGR